MRLVTAFIDRRGDQHFVHLLICAVFLGLLACEPAGEGEDVWWDAHGEPSDLVLFPDDGKADGFAVFYPNNVVNDWFFEQWSAIDAEGMQQFLEDTPYGRSSFLAYEDVGGRTAAEAIVEVASAFDLNPVLMVVRMQVEQSLVSRSERPSDRAVDFAFGCGCHDNRDCNPAFRGLDKQIECAADTLRTHFDGSMDGTGWWRRGQTRRTLDPMDVTPQSHGTASLYAYTPWVLEGSGGNWLNWNITRRFVRHMTAIGVLAPNPTDAWVGTPCLLDDDCGFERNDERARCFRFAVYGEEDVFGFCTLSCEGYCPDRSGHATTFCVSSDGLEGFCVASSASENQDCDAIPGTAPSIRERFVGSSPALQSTNEVCWPR